MIWLFRSNDVFWGDKPKVNESFRFDTNDIEFDITKYDISLYLGIANYYLMNESNDSEIYLLRFVGANNNPVRILISEESNIYKIIKNYVRKLKIKSLKNEL